MQCQARRVLVHVTYQGKIAEKKGISSIQRNIRLYYNCRDWAWYQFYTMVKGEMGALKKKLAEEERRKQMAEGLAKFQAILAQSVAEREAAQAANEAAGDGAAVALDQYTAHVNKERADLKALNANTKATLTKTKEDLTKELAAAKATLTKTKEDLTKEL